MNLKLQNVMFGMIVALTLATVSSFAADVHMSTPFQGPKANKGTVTHSVRNGKSYLTLSDDFVVPDTPDPHWQLVDSSGTVYLVDKLKLKGTLGGVVGDRIQKEIEIPKYVKNVSKVVIWCAWAEANLGEAGFSSPVK